MLKWIYGRDGRIHCSFSTTKTTGRLGCSDPNLQNIPTRDLHGIRAAFIAPPGYKLIVIDHSQLEMRVLACASGDRTLIDAIIDGLDYRPGEAILGGEFQLFQIYPDHIELLRSGATDPVDVSLEKAQITGGSL